MALHNGGNLPCSALFFKASGLGGGAHLGEKGFRTTNRGGIGIAKSFERISLWNALGGFGWWVRITFLLSFEIWCEFASQTQCYSGGKGVNDYEDVYPISIAIYSIIYTGFVLHNIP